MLSHSIPPAVDHSLSAIQLAGRKAVITAVSGGGDSLALLFLLLDHMETLPERPSLQAVTVDHGLRPESAEEAHAVGKLCAAHGVAHRILRWEGPKPGSGLSAAAREARLRLLARAAEEAGSDLVLTGHTADDQAETLAMRLTRGSGRGVAGIAPATLYDGRVWFVRPLLHARRVALRTYLKARGIIWTDDPTNKDMRFERARLRHILDEGEIQRLNVTAREAADERTEAGDRAAALISQAARPAAPGLMHLSRSMLEQAEERTALYALRILLAVVGGGQHLPDERRVAALLERLGQEAFHATLARAVVAVRREHVYLHRESRNLPRNALVDGFVWDGRYRVAAPGLQTDLVLAPLGAEGALKAEPSDTGIPPYLARAALSAEPALWRGSHCLGPAAPARDGVTLRPVAGPWARLLPSFDLTPARAVARLIGADLPPPPPWLCHKRAGR